MANRAVKVEREQAAVGKFYLCPGHNKAFEYTGYVIKSVRLVRGRRVEAWDPPIAWRRGKETLFRLLCAECRKNTGGSGPLDACAALAARQREKMVS